MTNLNHVDQLIREESALNTKLELKLGYRHPETIKSRARLASLRTARDVLYHNDRGHLVYIGPRGMIDGTGRL